MRTTRAALLTSPKLAARRERGLRLKMRMRMRRRKRERDARMEKRMKETDTWLRNNTPRDVVGRSRRQRGVSVSR